MIDPKTDPIFAAREALEALDYGGNWDNIDVPELVRNLLWLIDGGTTPPTEAETRENPWWLVSNGGSPYTMYFMSDGSVTLDTDEHFGSREDAIKRLSPGRWVPLDAQDDFRPRPRPVVPR